MSFLGGSSESVPVLALRLERHHHGTRGLKRTALGAETSHRSTSVQPNKIAQGAAKPQTVCGSSRASELHWRCTGGALAVPSPPHRSFSTLGTRQMRMELSPPATASMPPALEKSTP